MDILVALKAERDKLQQQLKMVDVTISMLGGKAVGKGTGSGISEAKRKKLSIALKKSWAKRKAGKGQKKAE